MNKFLIGLCSLTVGIGAGIVAGILIAPKSGVETRAELKEKLDSAYENGRNKMGEIVDKSKDVIEKGKSAIEKGKNAMKKSDTTEEEA